jgi:DNA-binding SARP family transcriptional activator/Tfp pilus assembly protein PilF
VLARLIVAANRVVAADALAGELWPDLEAARAAGNLQVRIAELRRAFGRAGAADRLVTRPPGYLLVAGAGEVDAARFDRLAAEGRALLGAGDAAAAAGCLAEALGLWRGPPLADVGDLAWARAEAARLGEARLAAVECYAQARLACGQASELTAELEALTGEHRLRERLWGLRMLALYRSGRQAEALEAYQQLRAILVEELGIEPSAELRQLHQQILVQDPGLAVATLGPAALARERLPDTETPAAIGDASAALAAVATAGAPAAAVPVPRELPADVTGFTGRAVELAELDFLLPTARQDLGAGLGPVVISAVSGTAGVGKTALTIRWAHRAADMFPDGQLYVNLRGYDPGQPVLPGDALARFLRALGVGDQDMPLEVEERAARYRSIVASRRLLVVLDNAASEEQVRPLLPGSGSVMVVVTSRDSLAGLVARDGARRLDLGLLPPAEAVALLTTLIGGRADADPGAVGRLADLCARLPLALRVAAELAIVRPDTPLAALAAELASQDDRLELLDVGGDPRTAVASVFSWSYRHLPAEAARMFRLLGLHPGADWDQYAAAALTGTGSLPQARQLQSVLARAHLIQPAGSGRYGMHDLLRAYASSLATTHDSEEARQAALTGLFDYYLAASAAAMTCLEPATADRRPAPPSVSSPVPQFGDRAAALGWLDAELGTLVSVVAHTASHGWPSHTTRLAETLMGYIYLGHVTEGLTINRHAVNAARESGDRAAQSKALNWLGSFHSEQGRHEQAAAYCQQALALARDIGNLSLQARALMHIGYAHFCQGRLGEAAHYTEQAAAVAREQGSNSWDEHNIKMNLSDTYIRLGRYQEAEQLLRGPLVFFRELGDLSAMACTLNLLGWACCEQGRYREAVGYQQEALAAAREMGDRWMEADGLTYLGRLSHRQGRYGQAAECHQQALALYREIGAREGEAEALNGAGQTLLATGQPDQARACHANALALTRQAGDRYLQAHALTGLGEVSHRQGQHTEAAEYYQQALALFQAMGSRGGQAEALNGTAEALLATGQRQKAQACLTEALTLAEQTGDRYQQARAHQGLAAVCHAVTELDQERQHWQEALDIYSGLGVPEAAQMTTSAASPAGTASAGTAVRPPTAG